MAAANNNNNDLIVILRKIHKNEQMRITLAKSKILN